MNEWTVVLVISTLLGMGAIIIRPIIKLNTTITTLNANVENLVKNNNDCHTEMKEDIKEHDQKIEDHEKRIIILEKN